MHNNFLSFNIIWQHFKLAKNYLIFFLTFWIVILIPIYCFPIWTIENSYPFGICIGIYDYQNGNVGGIHDELYRISRYFLFSTPSIIYFSIVFIFLINKFLISEIKNRKISYWIGTGKSRNTILLSKYVFMLIVLLLLYIPIFVVTTTVSANAYDAKIYFKYILYSELNFLAPLLCFFTLFFLLGVVLSNKKHLFDTIYSFFVIYFVITYILELLTYVNPLFNEIFAPAKYLSFSFFEQFILNFEKPGDNAILTYIHYKSKYGGDGTYFSYYEKISSAIIVIPIILTQLFLTSWFLLLSFRQFNKKNIYA